MIVVFGGTGLLGHDLVGRLARRGLPLRVVSRDPAVTRSALVDLPGVEVVAGDVRTPAALGPLLSDADVVVSAIQGFGGRDPGGMAAVDGTGNRNLIAASAVARVPRFVLMSIHGAAASHPLPLARVKYAAEQALSETGLASTIIRPTAYMETWAGIVGGPIIATGRARVFGTGRTPVNFVSAGDVAAIVERAVVDGSAAGSVTDVVGPEDLTLDDVANAFAAALGRPVPIGHVPPVALRVLRTLLLLPRPILADQIAGALAMDAGIPLQPSTASGAVHVVGSTRMQTVIAGMVAAAQRPAVAAGH